MMEKLEFANIKCREKLYTSHEWFEILKTTIYRNFRNSKFLLLETFYF